MGMDEWWFTRFEMGLTTIYIPPSIFRKKSTRACIILPFPVRGKDPIPTTNSLVSIRRRRKIGRRKEKKKSGALISHLSARSVSRSRVVVPVFVRSSSISLSHDRPIVNFASLPPSLPRPVRDRVVFHFEKWTGDGKTGKGREEELAVEAHAFASTRVYLPIGGKATDVGWPGEARGVKWRGEWKRWVGGGGGGRPSWRIHRSAAHNGHGFNGEREREAAKRFSRNWRFHSISWKKKKEKRKTRDDTSPRKSIFSKWRWLPRSLFNLCCGNPLRYFSIPTESFRVVIVSVIFFLSFFFFHPPVFDFVVYVRSSAKRHLSLLERRSEGFEGRTAVPLRGSFRSLREHLRGLRRS